MVQQHLLTKSFNLFTASMMTGPVDIFGGPTTFGGPGGPAPGGPGGFGFGPVPGGPGGPGGLDLHLLQLLELILSLLVNLKFSEEVVQT